MKVAIGYGQQRAEFDVPDGKLVRVHRNLEAPTLADPAAAVRAAIESPHEFPALRLALTPDDHIAIVVDDHLPQPGALLTPILETVAGARISPELITLISPVGSRQSWVDELPDAFQDVRLEVHDPHDRNKLSYLATTKRGRRVYLNRTLVDADQAIVLAARRYDPLLGYSGAATAIFPALSDQATRLDNCDKLSLLPPGKWSWPIAAEAAEISWLLGTPFIVQVIEASGDEIAHVVAGLAASSEVGQKLLDDRWRVQVDAPADVVVAGISGTAERQTLDDLARAFISAARVVKPGGRIVLLSSAEPPEDADMRLLSQAAEPAEVLKFLHEHKTPDMNAAFQWANAAQNNTLYLLSGLLPMVVEEMFTTPIENTDQAQRIVDGAGAVLFLPDAHKTMAEIRAT